MRLPLRALALLLSAPLLAASCGGGEPAPRDASGPAPSARPAASAEPDRSAEPVAPPPPPARRDDSIADDYALMAGDCNQLAERFTKLAEAEGIAKLDPKLSEAKRQPLEEKTREDAARAGRGWGDGCKKSLVGKTVSPQAIKCALGAGSIAAFEKCLNG